jgi:uncharacterized membrane protein
MKKIIIISIFVVLITGCTSTSSETDKPARLKEITGEVIATTLDSNGDIIINKDEVTDEVSYYDYLYEDVTIGLLAVKDSNGNIKVVINTCGSCGGSPYAYFVQVNDKVQCQNCGNLFAIDFLGELVEFGCNPIPIENMEEDNDTIKINHEAIEEYKDKFENWQGPKVA